jgi:hypothetical protein
MSNKNEVAKRREEPLRTPTFLSPDSVQNITAELNVLLADVFALYLKTKNFHWHVSGPHFRDYHLLLDEQGDQIFAMTGRYRRKGSQAGWNHNSINWTHRSAQTRRRQRRGICGASGHAERATRRQPSADGSDDRDS